MELMLLRVSQVKVKIGTLIRIHLI